MIVSTVASPEAPTMALEDLHQQIADFMPDVVVLVRPNGRCDHVSPASIPLLGRTPGELADTALQDLAIESDRHIVADLLGELNAGTSMTVASFRAQCGFGTWIWVEASARRLPAGAGAVLALRDISVRKEEEALLIEANELLRRRATLDPVTGLPNRGHFFATVERECRRAQRERGALTLLAVGVDEMRLFNDFYGRDAGDIALREIALAIEGALSRAADTAGRMSGPMVGVVLPGTDLAGAATVAERLRQAVNGMALEHAGVPSGRLTVTVSLVQADGRSRADALLREVVCEMEVARAASAPCLAAGEG